MSEERSCETCADGNGVGGCRLAIPDFTPDLQCWSPCPSVLQKKLTEALEENARLKASVAQRPADYVSSLLQGLLPPTEIRFVSDGHHTFDELYEFRLAYNACLFNGWAQAGLYDVHKSDRHADGEECFGGDWFVVVATTPIGQVSNHYRLQHWAKFHCKARPKAAPWDGHTAAQVAQRLLELADNLRGRKE